MSFASLSPEKQKALKKEPWNHFYRIFNAEEVAHGLDIIPEDLVLTPVKDKSPYRLDWQREDSLDRDYIAKVILDGEDKVSQQGNPYHSYASGFGIRTGDVSNGKVAIDIDGFSANPLLQALSNGDIPKTVSWTSGKPGRMQMLYQIPDDIRELLKSFTSLKLHELGDLKTAQDENGKYLEGLEFRYNESQSVLPPSRHPSTGEYAWIDPPSEYPVAIAPQWLCEFLIKVASEKRQKAQQRIEQKINWEAVKVEQKNAYQSGSGSDLVSFLNYEVLPRLNLEQIFNWEGHNFRQVGATFKGAPPWRHSQSGLSFHVWWSDEYQSWSWQDKGEGCGGGAVEYLWRLLGNTGTPKGRDFVEIVRELATRAGLELPARALRDPAEKKWEFPETCTSTPSAEPENQSGTQNEEEPQPKSDSKKNKRQPRADQDKVDAIQKHINTLTIQPHFNVIEVETRFLTQDKELLGKIPEKGILIFDVPMGMAKSAFIDMIINERFPDRPVTSITPTNALGEIQANDWNITQRENVGAEKINVSTMLRYEHRLGLCYPSLHKIATYDEATNSYIFKDNRDLILIQDEAREGLDFLHQSTLANKNNSRPYNIQVHKSLVANAGRNNVLWILADANIANPEVEYAQKLAPDLPVYVIRAKYRPPTTEVVITDSRESAEMELKTLLEQGENIIVPCDSQGRGEALDDVLKKKFKTLRIDKETLARNPEAQEFVRNPNKAIAKYQPQVVFTSPSFGSGGSITATREGVEAWQPVLALEALRANGESVEPLAIQQAEEYAKSVDLKWESGTPYFSKKIQMNYHLPPSLARQNLTRVRHPIPATIFVDTDKPIDGCRSPLPQEQIRQIAAHMEGLQELSQQELKLRADRGETQEVDSEQILLNMLEIVRAAKKGDNLDITLWAEQRARAAYSQEDRIYKIANEIKQKDGHKVTVIESENEEEKVDTKFTELVTDNKNNRELQKSTEIVAAQLLSEEEFKKIELKKLPSVEEERQISRYLFEKQYPGLMDSLPEEDRPNFYFYSIFKDRNHWLSSIKRDWEYSHRDELKPGDVDSTIHLTKRLKNSRVLALQDAKKIKAGGYEFINKTGIFETIPLDDFETKYLYSDLQSLTTTLGQKEKAKGLKTYLDKQPPKDSKQVIKWLNGILELFNRKLECVSKNGKNNERYYQLVLNIPDWSNGTQLKSVVESLDRKHSERQEKKSTEKIPDQPTQAEKTSSKDWLDFRHLKKQTQEKVSEILKSEFIHKCQDTVVFEIVPEFLEDLSLCEDKETLKLLLDAYEKFFDSRSVTIAFMERISYLLDGKFPDKINGFKLRTWLRKERGLGQEIQENDLVAA